MIPRERDRNIETRERERRERPPRRRDETTTRRLCHTQTLAATALLVGVKLRWVEIEAPTSSYKQTSSRSCLLLPLPFGVESRTFNWL